MGEEREGEFYEDMEMAIDQWMDAVPPFITQYYYCRKRLLKKVCFTLSSYFFSKHMIEFLTTILNCFFN